MEMFRVALNAIGKDPNTQNPADIEAAADALMKIRPYIRYVQTDSIIGDLANGEICLVIGYMGDFIQARDRALESHTGQRIGYSIPKDGSIMWFDSYLVPIDAPHPLNAHTFINYMLRPDVSAGVTNTIHFASGNVKAMPLIDKRVRDDPGVYPPPDVKAKLIPALADTPQNARLVTRLWTKFRTGT
jgi:putrescine transport system substrate-binding protein